MEALALLAVQFAFSISYPITAEVIALIHPLYWSAFRSVAAALLLYLCVRALKIPRRNPATRSRMFLLAFAGIFINQLFFVLGLARSTPTEAALVGTTIPVWVYVGALVVRQERFSWIRVTGIAVAIAGVFLLYGRPNGHASIWNFLGSFVYGSFIVMSWKTMRDSHPFVFMTQLLSWGGLQLFVAAVVASLLGWLDPMSLAHAADPGMAWRIAFLLTAGTILPYCCNAVATKRFSASTIGIAVTLQPLITALLERIFYARSFDSSLVWAGLMINTGVILSSLSNRRFWGLGRAKASTLAVLFGFLLLGAQEVRAQSFGDFFLAGVNRGHFKMQSNGDPFGADEEVAPDLKKTQMPELLAFYSKALGKPVAKWSVRTLPGSSTLPAAGLQIPYANTSILWARDAAGKIIAGFGPFRRAQVVKSGCAPVVFHLQIDAEGRAQKILIDPAHPLTKVGHEPLNEAELARALEIAQTLPDALSVLGDPARAAQEGNHFPAQTWTPLKPLLIEGAAYTSYRILEAALGARDALSKANKARQAEFQASDDDFGRWARLADIPAALGELPKMAALANDSSAARVRRLGALDMGVPMLLWAAVSGKVAEPELRKQFLAFDAYRGSRISDACFFYRRLLDSENGARVLEQIRQNPEGAWPSCGADEDKSFRILALAKTGQAEKLRAEKKNFDLAQLSSLFADDSALLALAAEAARLGSESSASDTKNLWADLIVRFPSYEAQIPAPLKGENWGELKAAARARWKEQIAHAWSDRGPSFPQVAGTRGKQSVTLPLKKTPRVYVFFASWCPHCQATFSKWARLPANVWKQIQPVEIFKDGSTTLASFCATTKIPAAACKSVVSLTNSKATDRFYDALGIISVPRLAVANAQGQLGLTDLKLPNDPETDVATYLDLVFEVARDSTK